MKTTSLLSIALLTGLAGHVANADGGAQHQAKQTGPVQMGTSGGSAVDASRSFCCGGTLGSLVQRNGLLHILSNNHVLGRSGSATAGEKTIQPGLIDVGCRASRATEIGVYAGNLVPLGTANVDAALARVTGNVDTTGAILDIGPICSTPQNPLVGLSVKKSGRTTGLTTGKITSVNTSVSIQYQSGCNSGKKFTVSFQNQIVTSAMSAGGDSGSLLVSDDGTPNPVGLLFAGSSTTTIHNPVSDVIAAFSKGGATFSFVGTDCGTAAAEPVLATTAASPSVETFNRALRAKVENEHALMNRPGVWGVGVGADENNPEEAAVVVYLESPAKVVPPSLPQEIDGTRVRVIFTDPIVAQ